jgi:hypothetical protein
MRSLLPLRFALPNYHATHIFHPSPRQVSFETLTLPPEIPVDWSSPFHTPESKRIIVGSPPTGGAYLIGGWESWHIVHILRFGVWESIHPEKENDTRENEQNRRRE